MATTKPTDSSYVSRRAGGRRLRGGRGGGARGGEAGNAGSGQGLKWARRLFWALAICAAVALAVGWPHLRLYARTAASYGARVGCSCRYVGGRGLADCTKDFEPGMGLVWLREDAAAHRITARFALLASQSATWRPGPGCVLEPWQD